MSENLPMKQQLQKGEIEVANGVQLRTLEDLWRMATLLHKANTIKGVTSPEQLAVVIQKGLEVGLPPVLAAQSIAFFNGRPLMWGDAGLALLLRSPLFDNSQFEETWEGKPFGDDYCAVCKMCRVGGKPLVRSFSVAMAKAAGLWDKVGPWKQYPARMMQMRARWWASRDAFPDVLNGIAGREEFVEAQYAERPRTNGKPGEALALTSFATVVDDRETPDPTEAEIE
jgi:hypothetical protein